MTSNSIEPSSHALQKKHDVTVKNQPRRPRQGDTKPGRHLLSGLFSGVLSAVALQPLDLLKTRVQQSGNPSLHSCLREINQSPGLVRTLWRGTVPSAMRTGIGSGLYFSLLNGIRQQAQSQAPSRSSVLPTLSNSANLLSGATARTLAGLILMPLTVIKVRFESNIYSYPSMWAAAADIGRRNGVTGFFAGFGATAIRDAPYAGAYVLFYEMFKKRASVLVESGSVEQGAAKMRPSVASLVNFGSAIVAGAVCAIVSNPFDAAKTRIQLQPNLYRNTWRALYKMVAEDGMLSLWSGLALRMSRKALGSALVWTIYEELARRSDAKR